jgi:hypothetical protein
MNKQVENTHAKRVESVKKMNKVYALLFKRNKNLCVYYNRFPENFCPILRYVDRLAVVDRMFSHTKNLLILKHHGPHSTYF